MHLHSRYMGHNSNKGVMSGYRIRDANIYNNTILYQKLIINLPQCDVYVSFIYFIPDEFTFVFNTMESKSSSSAAV